MYLHTSISLYIDIVGVFFIVNSFGGTGGGHNRWTKACITKCAYFETILEIHHTSESDANSESVIDDGQETIFVSPHAELCLRSKPRSC